MEFLPEEYKIPSSDDGYLKPIEGTIKFRVLSQPILGMEYWIDDGDKRKPMRVRMGENTPVKYADSTKHFWVLCAWNCDEERVQILTITQKSIQKAIVAHTKNKDWGSPFDYDLTITGEGKGFDREYSVMASPKTKLDSKIQEHYDGLEINLEALYDGDNPFQAVEADETVKDAVSEVVESLK